LLLSPGRAESPRTYDQLKSLIGPPRVIPLMAPIPRSRSPIAAEYILEGGAPDTDHRPVSRSPSPVETGWRVPAGLRAYSPIASDILVQSPDLDRRSNYAISTENLMQAGRGRPASRAQSPIASAWLTAGSAGSRHASPGGGGRRVLSPTGQVSGFHTDGLSAEYITQSSHPFDGCVKRQGVVFNDRMRDYVSPGGLRPQVAAMNQVLTADKANNCGDRGSAKQDHDYVRDAMKRTAQIQFERNIERFNRGIL